MQKAQLHASDRTVPLFADDDFGDPLILRLGLLLLVHLGTVNEQDDIGILFEGSGLAEIRQLRSVLDRGLPGLD